MSANRNAKDRGQRVAREAQPNGKSKGSIDSRIQLEIGRQLRAAYDDIINEPVPDRFLTLLRQLEKSASPKAG